MMPTVKRAQRATAKRDDRARQHGCDLYKGHCVPAKDRSPPLYGKVVSAGVGELRGGREIIWRSSMTDDPMHDDATTAYLFQCGESDLFAVSHDPTGANIPRAQCAQGWLVRDKFRLGVREPMPASIEPEPVIRGIAADGYYVWRRG